MSLLRRVILGCLAVAVVLTLADVVLASTFRAFLLQRVDEQLGRRRCPSSSWPPGPSDGRRAAADERPANR